MLFMVLFLFLRVEENVLFQTSKHLSYCVLEAMETSEVPLIACSSHHLKVQCVNLGDDSKHIFVSGHSNFCYLVFPMYAIVARQS